MNSSKRKPHIRCYTDLAMSDKTLVLNVEELIGLCFGPSGTNVANFKMMETVLYHLARQMRLLEQDVEIRFDEDEDMMMAQKKKQKHSRDTSFSKEKRASSSDPKEKQKVPYSQKMKKQHKRKMSDDKETTDKAYGGKRTIEKVAKPKKGDMSHVVGDKGKAKIQSKKGQMVHDSSAKDEKHDRSREEKTEEISKYGDTNQSSTKDESKDESGKKDRSGKPSRKEKKGHYSSGLDDADGDKGTVKKALKHTKVDREKRRGQKERDIDIDKIQDKMSKDHSSTKTTDDTQSIRLTISEVIRKGGKGSKDTILIVEKGPTTRDSEARLGRIDVVTRSQFNILKANVDKLMTEKAPKPVPSLPDNKKMRIDLASGSATLPEAMEATQLNARIKKTEDTLTRMADLLTQLAAMGAFPPEMTDLFNEFVEEQQELARISALAEESSTKTSQGAMPSVSQKSVGLDPKSSMASSRMGVSRIGTSQAALSRTGASRLTGMSIASVISKPSTITVDPTALVTQSELQAAIEELKNELNKEMELLTAKSTVAAEGARNLAQTIEEKLKVPLEVNKRIDGLVSLTADYVEQLSGFDSGLTTQLLSFHEQMAQLEAELKEGINNLDSMGKVEGSAMIELRNYHEIMGIILKESKTLHNELVVTQEQITEEMKNQLEWLEVLREEKADREEVDDGLRDKADLCRLAKLLNEDAFEKTRVDLLSRMSMCYDKFRRQDDVWLNALNDLTELANNKADMVQFWELRDKTANEFMQIETDLRKLEIMLGEPKAAILTRNLTSDTHDKTCMIPELMVPCDDSGKPPLHVCTLDYPVDDGPCLKEIRTKATDDRKVFCKRWVGGSHTMLTEYTTRENAQPLQLQMTPTKHYCSYGTDGRLYMLEEELQPCIECNQLPKKESRIEVGGGDQGPRDKDLGIDEKVSIVSDNRRITQF